MKHLKISCQKHKIDSLLLSSRCMTNYMKSCSSNADPEGGTGGPDPPGKSQVIWVSIGNKQLDPPPWKSWTPPPWKMLYPLWNLENDRFLWNWPFDFCKISWGLKKNKKKQKKTPELFLSDWPGPPLMKIPGSAHVHFYMLYFLE